MRRSVVFLSLVLLLLANTASAATLGEQLAPFKGRQVSLYRSDRPDQKVILDEVGADYLRVSFSSREGHLTAIYIPFSVVREVYHTVDKEKGADFVSITLVYNGPIR